MKGSLIVGSLLALTVLGGCAGAVGNNVAKYTNGTVPVPPTEAMVDGQYGLYYSTDVSPQVKYLLKKGDRLGFIQRDGKIYAVAGEKEAEVETSWRVRDVYWRQLGK